jgi:hypothetical protein
MKTIKTMLALVWLVGLPAAAAAQATATTGQIEGTIIDEQGGALPGVVIGARNTETGFERSSTTDSNGLYRLSLLPIGTYELTAELTGFGTVKRGGVEVHVGENITVPIEMRVAAVQETVTVTAESPVIEVSRSHVANTINETSIDSLPINGRRFQDFVLLTPGTVVESQRNGTSINGQRGINASYAIDGASYDNPFFGGIRGGERSGQAYTISQEAIREFQVSNSGYVAEFGRSGGGVVNAVTKSGTNDVSGSGFWFFQNQDFVADDPFGNPPVDFTRHQFGGSVGGPIRLDRVHYFLVYDQQTRDNPLVIQFPSDPTGVPRFGDTGTFERDGNLWKTTVTQTNDIWTTLGRVDVQLSERNHMWTRYNWSYNEALNGTNTGPTDRANTNNGTEKDRIDTFVTQLDSVLSASRLNELRFQYSREDRPREPNTLDPTITVSGFGTAGRVTFLPSLETDYRYQVVDNFTWLLGTHSFRVGADVNLVHVKQPFFLSRSGGEYRFNSLDDYLATVAGQQRWRDFRQGFGRADVDFWQKEFAVYLQDSWKVQPNLSLNYGLRYEAQVEPQPDAPNPTYPLTGQIPSDMDNFGPRFGLSWDPWKDNRGVVRANAGLYFSRTPALLLVSPFTNNGVAQLQLTFTPTSPGAPVFPNVLAAPPAGVAGPRSDINIFADEFENPRTFQGTVGIEREIATNLTIGADAVYARMRHLERLFDANLPPGVCCAADGRLVYVLGATNPIGLPRPDANFNRILRAEDTARGMYAALMLSARKRFMSGERWFQRGLQTQVFYTYARSKDDDSNERNFSGTFYQDWEFLEREYTWSNNDVRHSFGASATWTLPADFQLGAIVAARSGVPYTRGAVFVDLNFNGTFDDDREFVNGVDTGRNAFRQPNYYKLDLRVTKSVRIGSQQSVEVGLDAFNLLNNSNEIVGNPNRNFVSNPNVGVTNEFLGVPRSAQISLRYRF